MFDSRQTQAYRAMQAPASLKARIFADAEEITTPVKKTENLGNNRILRYAAALAACLLLAVSVTLAARTGGEPPYLCIGDRVLDRVGDTAQAPAMAARNARSADVPSGVPFELRAADAVTIELTGGTLWSQQNPRTPLALPATIASGTVLYWLPDGGAPSVLTLTCDGISAVYTMRSGENADITIIFDRKGKTT